MARSTSLKVGPFSGRFLAAWHALESAKGRKVNATELAGILGVSTGLITQWMDPKTNVPPQARVLTIAKACGVDPGWLAFGEATAAPMVPGSEGAMAPASMFKTGEQVDAERTAEAVRKRGKRA